MFCGRQPSGRLSCFFIFMAITCFFAPPGSGKSCVLSLICDRENKKINKGKSPYKQVFTNFACKGGYQISLYDFERYYIHDSLILLDEVTMEADSRDWKRISKEFINFVVTHRHLNNDIICAVQDFTRLEKTLRENVTRLYFLERSPLPFFNRWTRCKQIFRELSINEMSSELTLGYRFSTWVDRTCRKSMYRRFYLPKAYGLFDSFDPYGLDKRPEKDLLPWYPDPAPSSDQTDPGDPSGDNNEKK